jgi:predicted permease
VKTPPVPRFDVLRIALLVIGAAALVVPRRERGRWREQWLGDLSHRWQALERAGLAESRPARSLVARAWGAWPHALSLRARGWRPDMLTHDLRDAIRLLVRRPAFALTAILTVGLGIGANAVIFSWADALLLNPMGAVRDQHRLLAVTVTTPTRDDISFSYLNYLDARMQRPEALADLAVFTTLPMSLRVGAENERVWGQLVSGNLFDLLGVRAAIGRTLSDVDDGLSNRGPAAVLSDDLWRRRFAARPDIVGTSIVLNGRAFTVVGVAEPGFRGTMAALRFDLFVPLAAQSAFYASDRLGNRGHGWLQGLARLADGASIQSAQAGLDVVAARLAREHPGPNAGRGMRLFPLWRAPTGGQRMLLPAISVLGGIVGVLLLLVCANLAGLLLARGAGRRREIAVRRALGAGRGQLVRQLLVESLVLAVLGGLLGTWLAAASGAILEAFIPPLPIPLSIDAGLNLQVLLFSAAVSVGAGLVFGLLPATQASRGDLTGSLRDGAGTADRWRRARLRQGLVVVQVALALVLLVSAGLFMRSMRHAYGLDPGFSARQGVIGALDLLPAGYDAARGRELYRRLAEELRAVPGVEDATVARRAPLTATDSSDMRIEVDGHVPARNEEMTAYYNQVGPRYFSTLQLPLVRGREFDDRDTDTSPRVVIVSRTMAERYWRGRSAIGGRVRVGPDWLEVVGVAADAKYGSMNEAPRAYMYLPLAQFHRPDTRLIVRTAGDPAATVAPLRAAVARVDANLPLFDLTTIAEHMAFSYSLFELVATVLGLFGLAATFLASLGLYGVVALTVAQRTREIGVRIALGASGPDVLTLVLRQGLAVVLAGVACGLVVALVVSRLFSPVLVGVGPYDLASYAVTVAVLVATAAAACYVPARRAARVDPVVALKGN